MKPGLLKELSVHSQLPVALLKTGWLRRFCFPWKGRKGRPRAAMQCAFTSRNMIHSHEVNTRVGAKLPQHKHRHDSPRNGEGISVRLPQAISPGFVRPVIFYYNSIDNQMQICWVIPV